MEKYIYDNSNGLWYELQGDYYIPCLVLPDTEERPNGIWGRKPLDYIKDAQYCMPIWFSSASYTAPLLTLMFRHRLNWSF